MEDDKIQLMCWRTILTMLVLTMIGSRIDGAICPAACRCENDILKTTCSSASLEIVPIQLNPELHELDLSNNKIVHIFYSFSFYERLITLNLSNNRIKTLGNSHFNPLRNLTHLDLSSNQIENLTKDSLKGLKALTHLNLSNNYLEEISPTAFHELYSLTSLMLCANRLVHLEEGLFKTIRNLKELYLDDNQFLEIPTLALVDTVHLRYLSLSRNLILTIEENEMPNLTKLHTLLLDNNVITEIAPAGLASLPVLSHLDLSDNNLTTIPTEPLAKLSSLNSLRLCGNFVKHIPPVTFRGLFHLKILRMDRLEHLEQIDGRAFVDNIGLERVYMDNNVALSKLPTRLFHGNPRIKFISIKYNNIKTLEVIHFPLDQLEELRIGGNPLQCNCSLGWLWQLIQEYKLKSSKFNMTSTIESKEIEDTSDTSLDLILDQHDIICKGPESMSGKTLASISKPNMDCSVGWMAAFSIIATLMFISLVIGGVVYWAPKRRTQTNKMNLEDTKRKTISSPKYSSPAMPSKNDLFHPNQTEKCIVPPHMMIHDEYRSIPSWDPYRDTGVNIYDRPHIVYV